MTTLSLEKAKSIQSHMQAVKDAHDKMGDVLDKCMDAFGASDEKPDADKALKASDVADLVKAAVAEALKAARPIEPTAAIVAPAAATITKETDNAPIVPAAVAVAPPVFKANSAGRGSTPEFQKSLATVVGVSL